MQDPSLPQMALTVLITDFLRYALAAGAVWFVVNVLLRRRLAGRRILEAAPAPGQVRREIVSITRATAATMACTSRGGIASAVPKTRSTCAMGTSASVRSLAARPQHEAGADAAGAGGQCDRRRSGSPAPLQICSTQPSTVSAPSSQRTTSSAIGWSTAA